MALLETRRLILREMNPADVESLHLLFSDPLFMRFWPVFDRSRTEQRVEASLRSFAESGFGLWALTRKGSDVAIGDCGLEVIEAVEGAADIQIGWHVRRDLWGQGLATEAALACRDYGFDHLGLDHLGALIHPDNLASRRVAEKIGMTLRKQIEHRAEPGGAMAWSAPSADRRSDSRLAWRCSFGRSLWGKHLLAAWECWLPSRPFLACSSPSIFFTRFPAPLRLR